MKKIIFLLPFLMGGISGFSQTNTFLGSGAGTTTSGGTHTGIGWNALQNSAGTNRNTAVGFGVLSGQVTGSGNTALGAEAMSQTVNIVSSEANTAVGAYALRLNTSGSLNTAVGNNALQANSTGADNVGLGYRALISNSAGSSNVGVGSNVLYTATGSQNIGVGASALRFLSSGFNNTAVGTSAGYSVTGSSNLFLGHMAGFNMTTGNYNVIIGKWKGNAEPTLSNTIIVATAGASNPSSDGAERFRITSDGFMGLGTTTPGNKLEIKGVSNNSGLRFTSLLNSNFNTLTATTSKKVLSVNAVGDVILVDDMVGTGGSGITSTCGTANFITKSSGTAGNLACTSIYDDGAGHVGFGFGASPNTAVNVSINGSSATYGGTYNVSDKKFKDHIQPITNALDKVMNLDGQTYNWKKETYKNINFSDELQYGLIAQDVQKVIPSLVLKSDNGDLALNYIGLIPVLIEAIKDQQSQIEELKAQLSDNFQKQNHELIALENTKIISVSPNPSNDVISVSLNIEKSVTNAKLVVYDLKGAILSSLNINDRDNNITKTLQKDNFGKGVYIVSLMINGKSIDSKKIIFN